MYNKGVDAVRLIVFQISDPSKPLPIIRDSAVSHKQPAGARSTNCSRSQSERRSKSDVHWVD
jgi:hypothetical protein